MVWHFVCHFVFSILRIPISNLLRLNIYIYIHTHTHTHTHTHIYIYIVYTSLLPLLIYGTVIQIKVNENERRTLFPIGFVPYVRGHSLYGEFSAATASSNDRLRISHLNDSSRSADRTKFCPSSGLLERRRFAHVFESNFLRYNLTAFNHFPIGIYLDSVKPLGWKCEVLALHSP